MRRRKILWTRWLLSMVALSFWLSACAAGTTGGPSQAAAPSSMEELLIQAGFEIFPESSPKCQRVCQTMPPEQLVPEKKGDKMLYAYYAPAAKRLYVGDEAAYQRFINLAVLKSLEPRKRAVLETVPDDPQFWTMWQDRHGGG